jgi:sugar lactone lactonase YvrE
MFMRSIGILIAALGCFSAIVVTGQAPAPAAVPAAQTGPGVQALQDARFPAYVAANCKTPPAGRAGGGRGPAPRPLHRDYKVAEIPGVIAAGQVWRTVWTGTGNNADGPVATRDGGMMFAQNSRSQVMKLGPNGEVSFPYSGTNTGGALAMNTKGELFIVQRGLPQEIWQLAPKRRRLANSYMGEPLDCAGTLLNDLTADSKGGVYFTKGGVHYADAKGVVTKYGTVGGNGIILSPDEKTLYVTGRLGAPAGGPPAAAPAAPAGRGAAPGAGRGGGAGAGGGLVAFDVQPDGSLTNERQFALVGGDGTAVDAEGRVYSTGGGGIQVVDKDGKFLGEIPTPLPLITAAFGGKDKKTMYGVANNQQYDEIFTIQMIAEGYKGRAK